MLPGGLFWFSVSQHDDLRCSSHSAEKTRSEHRGPKDIQCTTVLNDPFPTSGKFASYSTNMAVMDKGTPCLGTGWENMPFPTSNI